MTKTTNIMKKINKYKLLKTIAKIDIFILKFGNKVF